MGDKGTHDDLLPDLLLQDLLRDDPALDDLLRALSLTSGFAVHLMICETAAVARSCFALLRRELPGLRGAPTRVEVIDPYEGEELLPGPSGERLIDKVLPRLCAPAAAGDAGDRVVVLDASRALSAETSAWVVLFERLNERRNLIRDALVGPLILCLTPSLEQPFAAAAPDFWSIRSAVHRLVTPADLSMLKGCPGPLWEILQTDLGTAEMLDAASLQEQIAELHAHLPQRLVEPKTIGDYARLMSLVVLKIRLSVAYTLSGDLPAALAVAEESIELSRLQPRTKLGHERPMVARCLLQSSAVCARSCLHDRAWGRARDAARQIRRLRFGQDDHRDAFFLWIRALSAQAAACRALGNPDRAYPILVRIVKDLRHRMGLMPDLDCQGAFIKALEALLEIELERGAPDAAERHARELLATGEGLFKIDAQDRATALSILQTRAWLAQILIERGAFVEAEGELRWLEERLASDMVKALLTRDGWNSLRVLCTMVQGVLMYARGDEARGRALRDDVLRQVEEWMKAAPDSIAARSWMEWLRSALEASAGLDAHPGGAGSAAALEDHPQADRAHQEERQAHQPQD